MIDTTVESSTSLILQSRRLFASEIGHLKGIDCDLEGVAVGTVLHDIGLAPRVSGSDRFWTNRTFDYIGPSIALAHDYLIVRAREAWTVEIEGMIADHHKITSSMAGEDSLIEAFRRAAGST